MMDQPVSEELLVHVKSDHPLVKHRVRTYCVPIQVLARKKVQERILTFTVGWIRAEMS